MASEENSSLFLPPPPNADSDLSQKELGADLAREGELEPGVALIKTEFVLPYNSGKGSEHPESEPPPSKKRRRGQNKKRPRAAKIDFSEMLCPTLHDLQTPDINDHASCPFGEKCRYTHDITKFIASKPPDISDRCYVFEKFGMCPFGVACRCGSSHLTSDFVNIVIKGIYDPDFTGTTCNILSKELQDDLRKRRVKFERSNVYLDKLEGRKVSGGQDDKGGAEVCPGGVVRVETDGVTSGAITDGIKLRPCEKRQIDFRGKLYLAPLTTTGNLPFRRICKEFGADITCGEMAMCTNLLQGQLSEWALLRRHQSEDLFGVQLCGSHADTMTKCAELINSQTTVDFVDINTGCPIDLVFKKGAGSALMGRQTRFEGIVKGMVEVLDCPLTVKMRTGIHKKNWNAHKLVPKLRDWGVSMVTIHGRSREQRYTKQADWEYIQSCVEAARAMPVFGNGDILSYEDYNRFCEESGVAGTMIARGALIKPWVFTEIKEQRHWDIRSCERFEILRRYTNYGLEHWGSDTQGVENTRKFLLEWLSFLYRYIPVGLLERVPQKINQRPPYYRGRDDLETLMASNNCQDWIKLSEMLLGPAPDNFSFLPKHRANAYD